MSTMSSTSSSLQSRLQLAKKLVRDATVEALKTAQSEETLPGVHVGGESMWNNNDSPYNDLNFKFGVENTTGNENTDPNTEGAAHEQNPQDLPRDDELSAADDAAAFDLGMTLFGDDVSAIERDISSKLLKVEEELRDIISIQQASQAAVTSTEQDQEKIDAGDDEIKNDIAVDPESVKLEALKLTKKILFLRQCSAARLALDESTSLHMPVSTGATVDGSKQLLVESAELLARADAALKGAENELAAVASDEQAPTWLSDADVEVADRIMDSIRVQIRRKRVDLLACVSSVFDSCITIKESSISVRGGGGGSRSVGKLRKGEGLTDVFDALAVLSKSSASEKDGYRRQDGNKLEDALHLLADNLYSLVLKQAIVAHESCRANGTKTPAWQVRENVSPDSTGMAGHRFIAGTSPSVKGPIVTLEWRQSTSSKQLSADAVKYDPTGSVLAWTETLMFIRTILEFVHETALMKRADLSTIVGKFLFGDFSNSSSLKESPLSGTGILGHMSNNSNYGPLMKQLVRVMWETCIPESSSPDVITSLPHMAEKIRFCTDEFERDLIKRSFLLKAEPSAENDSHHLPLSSYARNFERKYAEKRRAIILAGGRDLLMNNDYHNTIEVGVDVESKRKDRSEDAVGFDDPEDGMSVFVLHKSAISQVASKLMSLCRETMDAAVDPCSNGKGALALLPPTLYRTTRELLDLFRAVIPAAHGSEISTIPRTAAVLHNDCVFFAHNMLTFGLEYRDKFLIPEGQKDSALRQLCTFVDLVPPFRELAERSMGDMIERQNHQLAEIVGLRITVLREALRSREGVVEWTEAETALTAGLYHLRHLSQTWRPILSHDIYGRAMGILLDSLYTLYLDQIMKAQDISEPACHFLSALFRDARRGGLELFNLSSPDKAQKGARKFCNSWDKFTAIGLFLDMSLADITLALSEGVFRAVTGPELSRLIVAVFEDSAKRKKLVRLLASE